MDSERVLLATLMTSAIIVFCGLILFLGATLVHAMGVLAILPIGAFICLWCLIYNGL